MFVFDLVRENGCVTMQRECRFLTNCLMCRVRCTMQLVVVASLPEVLGLLLCLIVRLRLGPLLMIDMCTAGVQNCVGVAHLIALLALMHALSSLVILLLDNASAVLLDRC